MHLSLWTIESREFIYEWSTKKFPKINIEVLSTWTNLHLFALDKKSKIINIESEDLNVISKEFKSNFFLLLLTHVKSDCSVSQSLLNYVLTQAQCVLSMFVNLSDCKSVGEYKTKVTESSWTICQLLDTINQDLTQVPWCILSEAPQIVIAYSTSLLQACLRESLPTPLACLVSRERQLVATPSWNNLTTEERICLTAFSRIHSNISDSLIRIPSMDEHTSYRLVQVELIRDVAILILCGSDLSIPELKIKVNNYWSPLISDLYPFQLENLLYASVEGIPLNLRAFYKHQKDKQFCVHGFLRLDVSMDNWINLTMKKLFLRSKIPQSQKCLNASYSVIFEKIHNISIIVYQPSNLPKVLILAFDGQVAHNDIRQLVSQVDTKLDQWLQSGNQI